MESEKMKNQAIHNNIYWLRAISCISVVVIHAITISLRIYDDNNYDYAQYIQLLLMFATPSFVIISEFLIANAYNGDLPKHFFRTRFKSLIIPYISTGLIFAIVFAESFNDFIYRAYRYILLADSIGYFVIIIFQFYLLHYLISKHLKRMNPIITIGTSLMINVIYLVFFAFAPAPDIAGIEYFWMKGYFMLFPAWLFYFTFGYYLGSNFHKIQKTFKKYLPLYILSFLVFTVILIAFKYLGIINSVSSKRIDILLFTASFVLVILALFNGVKKVPKFIGFINKYSFNIYLIHTLPMNLLKSKFTNIFWIDVFLVFLISLAFSIIISKILHLNKYGYLIIGKPLKVRS